MKELISKNLRKLPPYLFVELDKAKRKAIQEGRDIIDLGVGDPDLPTPSHIIDKLCSAVKDPKNHRYALDQGMPELRQAIASWYNHRFQVKLDPADQIQPLIGSKEGIAHLPFVFLNPGEFTLVPDPCYPPYRNCTVLAGCSPYTMPLLEKNDFLPDLTKIPKRVANKSKIIFINYPNNPTSAIINEGFIKDLIKFSRKYNIIIASDLAYSELAFDGYLPPSILEFTRKDDLIIEFHSLSKTFNMTGWRIGWACGNSEIVKALSKFKTNIDSGIFQAIQIAGISALNTPEDFILSLRRIYQDRRDIIISGLTSLGFSVIKPKATFYIWIKVPKKFTSLEFCNLLLDKADIIVTPGNGFGEYGEGFMRIALTLDKNKLEEAISRIKKIGIKF